MRSFFISKPRLLLFGFFISFFAGFGQNFFISIFNLEIRGLLNLSDGQFGTLYSLATLTSAVILIWFGKLIDTIDLRIYIFLRGNNTPTAEIKVDLNTKSSVISEQG